MRLVRDDYTMFGSLELNNFPANGMNTGVVWKKEFYPPYNMTPSPFLLLN